MIPKVGSGGGGVRECGPEQVIKACKAWNPSVTSHDGEDLMTGAVQLRSRLVS